MSKFNEDSQSTIWYLKSADHQSNYHLILTNGTIYGIKNLESRYTVVKNVTEWINVWKDGDVKQTIICTSRSIFANAEYAQPDNAFDYTTCNNVHDFLVKGLGLQLDIVEYQTVEDDYWKKLVTEIDINNFNLATFFNSRYEIHELAHFDIFYKIWFREKDSYSRWLLSAYYTYRFCNKGYICSVLRECNNYSNPEFVQHLLLTIFDEGHSVDELEERNVGLKAAVHQNITVPDNVQELLMEKIHDVEEKMGARYAFQYLTLATEAEKRKSSSGSPPAKWKRTMCVRSIRICTTTSNPLSAPETLNRLGAWPIWISTRKPSSPIPTRRRSNPLSSKRTQTR